MSTLSSWMSWEGGVDLAASTAPDIKQPNVILHVARLVHTPLGSAPSGMVLYAPSGMTPVVMGFITGDPAVGAYFGPNIFAGTPFETAPVLMAKIDITSGDGWCESRIEVESLLFETRLENLGALEQIQRPAGSLPFAQSALEAAAGSATLRVNGEPIKLFQPPVGLAGGPAAVWCPTGMYTR